MIESLKNNPKQIIFIVIAIAIVVYASISNSSKKDENKEKKEKKEEVFECNSDNTYMDEYEDFFNKLYYKHSVSGLNWKTTRETDTECQYHTTIKVEDNSGKKEEFDLYITTSLDKENKKEHVNSLIVNNIEIYK